VTGIPLLPWAPDDVFCFVLYYKQRTHASALRAVGQWTREFIALALRHEGRYYLPYQLHATPEQFAAAYPQASQLRELKRRLDPTASSRTSYGADTCELASTSRAASDGGNR